MNKSIIIIIGMAWLLCTMYLALAKWYHYPGGVYAMAGSWIASGLLLISIFLFARKNKS